MTKCIIIATVFAIIHDVASRSSPIIGDSTGRRQRRDAADFGASFSNITPANRTLCQPGAEEPNNRVGTAGQREALRQVMAWPNVTLDAYMIPYEDEHISSPADYDSRLKYVSGFSGSNGYAWIVGNGGGNRQALWTDGRYFLQGDQQMDCSWILMKMGMDGYPPASAWLQEILPVNARVGMDPKVVSISRWQAYQNAFQEGSKTLELVSVNNELIDYIWDEERTDRPNEPLMIHDVKFAGREWTDKIDELREQLFTEEVDALFVTALDETAWLFNLRGYDRKTSPLFYSYGLVMQDEIRLYLTNYSKLLTQVIQQHLRTNHDGTCNAGNQHCVNVREYNNALLDLAELSAKNSVSKIWITPTSNYATYEAAGDKKYVEASPVQLMKAIKNNVERERYHECQVRDSAAVVDFVSQLEKKIKNGGTETEISAATWLENIRKEDENFVMSSFDAISAVGENAAVIHYRATEETDTTITDDAVYLLDSGGQYFDGTTDVTRTFHFGKPTEMEKEAYTRVLIGAIELATTVWPEGLHGYDIDARARAKLWEYGWNYNHGTGHGIGYFLNVHEGPGRITIGYSSSHSPLYDGMYFSDEPGYYEEGSFGIRLETIVEVEIKDTPNRFNDMDYLGFLPVTLVPFEPNLINYDMLTSAHRRWLNDYNSRCVSETGAYLLSKGKNEAYTWLTDRTAKLQDIPVWVDSMPESSCAFCLKITYPSAIIFTISFSMYWILLHDI